MGLSILKIAGSGTGKSLRSIFRSLNSYKVSRTISTLNRSDEDRVSSSSSSSDDSVFSSSSPLLMLSPSNYIISYAFYSFAKNRVFSIPKPEKTRYAIEIVGSSHGWLACFNHRRNELFLSNPLSGRRVNLPSICNLNISRYDLKTSSGINKIIISCSDPESEECRAMMLYRASNRLAFCCPGISSSRNKWITIKSLYSDIVHCATHKLFYAIKRNSKTDLELEAWDLRNPLSPTLVWSCGVDKLEYCYDSGGQSDPAQNDVSCFNHQTQYYLVVSQQGELFLVYRYFYRYMLPDGSCVPYEDGEEILNSKYPPKTVNYKVYKIVREVDGGKKVYMDGHLDDQVMFVGWLSNGMAMPAADADGFQPNTICFTDDTHNIFKEARGNDNGIYDYKNKTFHPCYYPCDYESLRRKILPPPLWFIPKLHGNGNGNENSCKKSKHGQTQK
ncbi:hypothetical protein CASFOL_008733 [Castilleja foliolosa]|uniref:KIB1-4 beta-propeller domain-containing protein n=1 Tax=Castilleja foliolosa TaxID=1961234 RepID=A0ABD3DZT7_9LAMI